MTAGSIGAIYSNEDVVFYLNPQITFFKVVYRKYTKFIVSEHIHRNPSKSDVINFNAKLYGDFLIEISLLYNQTGSSISIEDDHPLIYYDSIDLKIQNPSPIETIPIPYMKSYLRLKYLNKHNIIYNNNNGVLECNSGNVFQKMSLCGGCFAKNGLNVSKVNSIIPVPFSFSKDVGKSIPIFLIESKNGHDTSLTLKPNSKNNDLVNIQVDLLLKVANLSEEEKRRFKTTLNEYLVEKIFFQNINVLTNLYDVSERLPNKSIKEFYIENNSTEYINFSYNLFISGISILNRDSNSVNHSYFSKVKIYECFDGFNASFNGSNTHIYDNIAFIPIALDNRSSAPTGTINTSSNKVHLSFKNVVNPTKSPNIYLYITYYDILKLENGTITLLYGNN